MLRQPESSQSSSSSISEEKPNGGREKKKRGLSPFPMRIRGTSPFRRTNSSNSTAASIKTSNKTRGLSPFRRKNSGSGRGLGRRMSSDSSLGSTSSSQLEGSSKDLVVCHGSARSIVFRDHLRLAAKIIKEENGQQLLSDDEVSLDGDSSSDDENGSALGDFRNSIRQSIRETIRLSNNNSAGDEISREINTLAREMVPELDDVTLRVPYASEENVEIEGQQVHVKGLPQLELGSQEEFEPLLHDSGTASDNVDWTAAETEVYTLLKNERACVKTIKISEWPSFLKRFQQSVQKGASRFPTQHDDIAPSQEFPFNSFVTSTTLLPELGKMMRCYGSLHAYPVGVVFALPEYSTLETEAEATKRTKTWSWPAGYAAKTEFNIDHGRLINGREEALVSLDKMRAYNHDYVYEKDHVIAGRLVKGGFKVVPYNEVFLRVGGRGRIVNNQDCVSGEERDETKSTDRSFGTGMGLPVALFIRCTAFGDILNLFRARARMAHVLGEDQIRGMPIIVISHEFGVRVFSESLQHKFWKLAALKLNPFQNPHLAPMLKVEDEDHHPTKKKYLEQKGQEQLLFLDSSQDYLSLEESARIAGGFGATDDFVATILKRALDDADGEGLQKVMTAGLNAALRADDYYTARQLLVVYSLVASGHDFEDFRDATIRKGGSSEDGELPSSLEFTYHIKKTAKCDGKKQDIHTSVKLPSIDTWRLRNATNSQGILIVLGAAKILKGVAESQERTHESIAAVQEWVEYGEQSVAFRIASWSKQRAIELDTNVALEGKNSQFMAFVSNKAIMNRKLFAMKLQESLNGSTDLEFCQGIHEIVQKLHAPCLRLEILQYILGLDNRFSVDHIQQAMELAITCMILGST